MRTSERRRYQRWPVYLGAWLAFFLCQQGTLALVKARIGEPFRVAGPASEPELLRGDRVWAAKLPHALLVPQRDRLIVFRSVEEATPDLQLVKRVMGVAGDTLTMIGDTLVRNGQRLDEPYAVHVAADAVDDREVLSQIRAWQLAHYIGPDAAVYQPTLHDWGPIVVPPDHFFAMGDNRDESYDSRFYGFVPDANVRSRPRLIYWSWGSENSGTRPRRLGRVVH